ncbi:MAG: alpha/beta hydrolase [Verrucomicrobiales bacterium]|nr:alpha/beta hydrolase [Verrucomicrobiales bacterium]
MNPYSEILAQLEASVHSGNRVRALEIAREIQQRLVNEANERAAVERRLRDLLSELDRPVKRHRQEKAELQSTERSFKPANAGEDLVYPVWFGTNRKPDGLGGFGSERHNRTTRGRAEVFVPEGHRFGESGTPFWKKLLRFDLRDDTLRLQRVTEQQRGDWFGEIRHAMQDAKAAGDSPHALVFLHGFNVTFEEAAIRAAQIGVDLLVPGVTAFFSWPSRGHVSAYPADEASIEASEQAITDFLVDFTANCGAEKAHVIAHSMGNRGLLRALQRIAANAETRGKVKFDQIFLAAPDVDRDLFLNLARLYPDHALRTTLYTSDGDLPVHLSAKLHDAPRAGYYRPYTVAPGLDTVAVPDFDLDLLGHSYFAQAEALLYHIRDLMLNGQATVTRSRMAPALDAGKSFWKLKL